MVIQSRGYRTDLMFARFGGRVVDRGSYLVVATPDNPTFHWGNFLLFDRPPLAEDVAPWTATFVREFADDARVRHVAIGWDRSADPRVEAAPFAELGFAVTSSIVLTATRVHEPPRIDRDVDVRAISSDADWESVLELELMLREPELAAEAYAVFKREQVRRYRLMSEAGRGGWFGAFLDQRLVGGLGLYVEDGVGRFQNVGTHPAYRRRGVCGRLVVEAARTGLERMGAATLVMVADEGYHAARIYESIGFEPSERQAGACRSPQGNEAGA